MACDEPLAPIAANESADLPPDDVRLVELTVGQLHALWRAWTEAEPKKGKKMHPNYTDEYKGREFHLEERARVTGLVYRNVAVSYDNIIEDTWLSHPFDPLQPRAWGGIDHPEKWRRLRKRLVADREKAGDGIQFVEFKASEGGRATCYVSRRDWGHCAVVKALGRDAGPREVPAVLKRYPWGRDEAGRPVTYCAHCRSDPAATPTDAVQATLSEDEKSIPQATPVPLPQ